MNPPYRTRISIFGCIIVYYWSWHGQFNQRLKRCINLHFALLSHRLILLNLVPFESKSQVTTPDFGILEKARDWICDFDLPEFHGDQSKFVFPHVVCMTPLRIDGYILSMSAKVCIAGPKRLFQWKNGFTIHIRERCLNTKNSRTNPRTEKWFV